ncbi:MAG: hypothetical protein ACOCYC_01515 [bacterium]
MQHAPHPRRQGTILRFGMVTLPTSPARAGGGGPESSISRRHVETMTAVDTGSTADAFAKANLSDKLPS